MSILSALARLPFGKMLAFLAIAASTQPSSALGQSREQARAGKQSQSKLWIAPYFGVGLQSAYYDDVVQFSDGTSQFLTLDPGSGTVLGIQVGYRLSPKWTMHGNVSTASPRAEYVENLAPRPDKNLQTTQLEAGLLYDAASLRVGKDKAPLSVGGGLSMTSHSVRRFTWNGNAIRPGTTSIGAHALAALDIPLAPRVNFHGQAKLTVTPLSRGDLEEKIAAAQGGGVTATMEGGMSSYFQLLIGAAYRP